LTVNGRDVAVALPFVVRPLRRFWTVPWHRL